MDGLADDCNVLFLLTTNRPEVLEPALAARPGRVDQAVELALPDEAGRQRLFGDDSTSYLTPHAPRLYPTDTPVG